MSAQPDVINQPPHFVSSSGLECIDVIEAFDLNFRLGNVVKYVLRERKKGGLDDLKKARWYLDREIAKRERPLTQYAAAGHTGSNMGNTKNAKTSAKAAPAAASQTKATSQPKSAPKKAKAARSGR